MCHNCGVKSCNKCNTCNTCEPNPCPLRIFFKDVIACKTSDLAYEALKLKYGINNGDTLDVVAKLLLQNIDAINSKLDTLDINAITILVNGLSAKIGDLTTLKTTDKSTLVAAINEIFDKIGNLALLNTTDKTSVVNAINEVLDNLGDITTLTTTDKSSGVAAINEINAKATLGTLNNLLGVTTQATNFTDAINDRQPVWKKSTTVTVGASQAAPFNNLDTAVAELKKYHFESGIVTVSLLAGTYNITDPLRTFGQFNDNSAIFTFEGATGNPDDVIIQKTGDRVVWTALSNGLEFKNLTIKGGGTGEVIVAERHSTLGLFNVKVINTQSAKLSTGIIVVNNNGSIYGENIEVINNGHVDNTGFNVSTNGTVTLGYSASKTILSNLKYGFNLTSNANLSIISSQDVTISNIDNGISSYNSKVSIQTSAGKKLIITGKAKGTGSGISLVLTSAVLNRVSISAFNFGVLSQVSSGMDIYADISNVTNSLWVGQNSSGRIQDSVISGDDGILLASSNVNIGNTTSTATVSGNLAYKTISGSRVFATGSNATNANSNIPINTLQADGSIIIA